MVVYKITNRANGKVYIGKWTKPRVEDRWKIHCYDTRKGSDLYFHNAIRKYGPDAFKVEILYWAKDAVELSNMETFFIVLHQSHLKENGYNLTMGGDGMVGFKPDPGMLARRNRAIGDANRGRKPSESAVLGARQKTIERWRIPGYRSRMERLLSFYRNSPEVKQLKAEAMGSTEVRKKLSLAWTPERRAIASKRMAEWATGKQVNKGRFLSPEIRAKISKTKKRQNLEKKAMAVGA